IVGAGVLLDRHGNTRQLVWAGNAAVPARDDPHGGHCFAEAEDDARTVATLHGRALDRAPFAHVEAIHLAGLEQDFLVTREQLEGRVGGVLLGYLDLEALGAEEPLL